MPPELVPAGWLLVGWEPLEGTEADEVLMVEGAEVALVWGAEDWLPVWLPAEDEAEEVAGAEVLD